MDTVVDRLIRYAKVYSESDYHAGRTVTPSTDRQFDMAKLLVEELHGLGIENARYDDKCYVYATLDATPGCEQLPAIGLIAHMDTTPDMTGKDVKPQIIHYTGGDVVLNREQNIVMEAAQFPELQKFVGQELVCTDGTTLLGADDKAGIAIILQAVEELLAEKAPHGKICLGFTPDEEIGMGASFFDVSGFGADFAYTLDGGDITDYEYETFNAAKTVVTINGFSIHPGTSKDKMRNALLIAMEYNALLPALETPAHTEGYEGFFHLQEMHGKAEKATMEYIVRDHDMKRFQERKAMMDKAAEQINRRWGDGTAVVDTHDQYYNMYEVLKDHMEILELAESAMKAAGIEHPTHSPIRGGTDGSVLTYKGLLCPNLPSAGHNAHGRYEYAPVESLKTGVKTVKALVSPELVETIIGKKRGDIMYQERISRVLAAMERMGLEQMLVSDPDSIWYLTGYDVFPFERLYAFYLRKDGQHKLFLNKLFPVPEAPYEQVWFSDTDDYLAILANAVDGEKDMGVDKDWPARFLLPLMAHNPNCKYVLASDCVDDARACKDAVERDLMREASRINDVVMERAAAYMKEGMTEREVADYIVAQYAAEGCDSTAFLPIVSYGAHAADPHHEADQTRLKAGDCIVIDMGCRKNRYCSDMTRTFFCRAADPKYAAIHDLVREANELAESMLRPGVPLCDLDKAARDHISAAGYGEYFTHRLGHFIGQTEHEKGDVSATNTTLAKPGMIFSIEPGVYLPGEFGVRVEDLVLVTEDGCEILNHVDKHWKTVG